MYVTESCGGHCYRPTNRRLALFNAKDEYECYGEGYVKCFWGLCDHQKSIESLVNNTVTKRVITEQPCERQELLPYRNPGLIQSVLLSH